MNKPTQRARWLVWSPVNRPEQSLMGAMFTSQTQGNYQYAYLVTNSSHWIYTRTGVELAGWLAFEDYLGLVRSADVALALTTRDLTLLRGAWEAVYLGLPLVTSHWPALRACFGRGTIHVDNDAAAIGAGLRTALRQADALRAEMHQLGVDKRRAWDEALATLRALLVLPGPATRGE